MCFLMRKVNADGAGRDVYLSSPVSGSMVSGYHKIQGWVKTKPRPQHLGVGAKPTGPEK